MPDWVRKAYDTGVIAAIVSAIFTAGGFYSHVKDMDKRLNQIEAHLDSVDDYAHGRHPKQ